MEEQIQQLIEQLFQVLRTILDSTPPLLAQADESLQLTFDACIGTGDGS